MKPLSPRAKSALADYRSAHALPSEARARARRALAARLADPLVEVPDVTESVPPRLPGAGRLLRWRWLGGGFVLIGGFLLGATWLSSPAPMTAPATVSADRSAPDSRIPPGVPASVDALDMNAHAHAHALEPGPLAPTPVAQRRARVPRSVAVSKAVALNLALRPVSDAQPAPNVQAPSESTASEAPEPAATTPSTEPSSQLSDTSFVRPELARSRATAEPQQSLDAEVALLRAAHEQLRAGQPLRALSALTQHAERFPDGQLLEMRKVTRIMALCALPKPAAARAEAERFLTQHASSNYATRVRQLCQPDSAASHATGQ